MLCQIKSAPWTDDDYAFLQSAGFSQTTPTYLSIPPYAWEVKDLRAAMFSVRYSEAAKLLLYRGEPHECRIAVTMARAVDPRRPTWMNVPDWCIEGNNLTPSDMFGARLRIYLVVSSGTFFRDLYIQTIHDEE